MTCDPALAVLPFRVGPRVDAGGAGEVFRAWSVDGRALALKVSFATDDAAAWRVGREAALAQRMTGVAPRIESWGRLDDGRTYLAMEWLDGGTLRARLTDAPWSVIDVARVGHAIARALGLVHAGGIVHRDLKADNIMFRADGTAVLIDFGLAHGPADPSSSATRCAGTPLTMAPEQVLGDEVGPAADLYALGGLLYRLRTGRDLFTGSAMEIQLSHVTQPAPAVPASAEPGSAALANLIAALLRKRVDERPASAAVVTAALAALAPRRATLTSRGVRLAVAAAALVTVSAHRRAAAPMTSTMEPSPAVAGPPAPTTSQPWAIAASGDYTLRVAWPSVGRAGDRVPIGLQIWNDAGAALPLTGLAATVRDPAGHTVAVAGAALARFELNARRAGDYVLTVFAPDGDVTLAVTIPIDAAPNT